jgi:hypothetical protein
VIAVEGQPEYEIRDRLAAMADAELQWLAEVGLARAVCAAAGQVPWSGKETRDAENWKHSATVSVGSEVLTAQVSPLERGIYSTSSAIRPEWEPEEEG